MNISDEERARLERRRLQLEIEEAEERVQLVRGNPTYEKLKDDNARRVKFGATSIVAIGCDSRLAVRRDGGFCEWDTRYSDGSLARTLVGRFRPKKLSSSPAYITARIDYYDLTLGRNESVDYGCWLGQTTRAAEFSASDTQSLILVMLANGAIYAVDDKRDDVVHEHGVTLLPLPMSSCFARVHGVIDVEDVSGELDEAWFKIAYRPTQLSTQA